MEDDREMRVDEAMIPENNGGDRERERCESGNQLARMESGGPQRERLSKT